MSHAEHKDYAGAKLGMWLFLFTELLLFGGLFLLYAVYLKRYPAGVCRRRSTAQLDHGGSQYGHPSDQQPLRRHVGVCHPARRAETALSD